MNNPSSPALSLNPKLRGHVLKQIYRVWLFRKLLPVLIGEVVVLSVVLWVVGKIVFVQRILQNVVAVIFGNFYQLPTFLVSAFNHASPSTKLLGTAVLILVALVIRHVTQGILRLILVRENFFSKIPK